MGYWVDLENPYITFDNNYIESVWKLVKELHKRELFIKVIKYNGTVQEVVQYYLS